MAVAIFLVGMGGGLGQELRVLLFCMLGEAEPELRHREPVGLRLQCGRFLRKLQAALGPCPEFFREFHVVLTTLRLKLKTESLHSFR